MNPLTITEYNKILDRVYGTKDSSTVIRMKLYKYLGITIDFSLRKGVTISQYDFIKKFCIGLLDNLKELYCKILALVDLLKVDTLVLDLSKLRSDE